MSHENNFGISLQCGLIAAVLYAGLSIIVWMKYNIDLAFYNLLIGSDTMTFITVWMVVTFTIFFILMASESWSKEIKK